MPDWASVAGRGRLLLSGSVAHASLKTAVQRRERKKEELRRGGPRQKCRDILHTCSTSNGAAAVHEARSRIMWQGKEGSHTYFRLSAAWLTEPAVSGGEASLVSERLQNPSLHVNKEQ